MNYLNLHCGREQNIISSYKMHYCIPHIIQTNMRVFKIPIHVTRKQIAPATYIHIYTQMKVHDGYIVLWNGWIIKYNTFWISQRNAGGTLRGFVKSINSQVNWVTCSKDKATIGKSAKIKVKFNNVCSMMYLFISEWWNSGHIMLMLITWVSRVGDGLLYDLTYSLLYWLAAPYLDALLTNFVAFSNWSSR